VAGRFIDGDGERRIGGARWKSDGDGGAFIRSAVNTNLAVVTTDVGLADAETEASSLPAFGGEERFEYVRQDFWRNAASSVGNLDFY